MLLDDVYYPKRPSARRENTDMTLLWMLPILSLQVASQNFVTLSTAGRPTLGSPVVISRVFARGEIKDYALASVNGVSLFSQCDVKTRWDDGTVQHAIVSFRADENLNGRVKVDFINSPSSCSLGDTATCEQSALTAEAMQDFNGGKWGAAIDTEVNGQIHRVDAKTMLASGSWRYWLRGPVVTQAIIEDRTSNLKFDWGYKDRSTAVVAAPVTATATSFSVSDTSDLAIGATIRVDSEEMFVCGKKDTTVLVGTPVTCPSIEGRGNNSTKASVHAMGAILRLSSTPKAWDQRVIAYTPYNSQRGLAANALTMSVYGTDLLQSLPLPFIIQIGNEQLSVCKIAPGQPGTVSFGQSTDQCPNSNGRGLNGTKPIAHPDNQPIFSPQWGSDWIESEADRYRSLHPIFVATFAPGWPGVKIESIVENVWIDKMQDQYYRLAIRTGADLQTTRFEQHLHHRALTRWRKVFWDGSEPTLFNQDFNLDYLIESQVLPNFDRKYKVPPAIIQADYNRAKAGGMGDINATGIVYPAMPAAGGRADLGLFTAWDVRYLYTFDPRLLEVVLDAGHVSGYAPIHFRENSAERFFDSEGTTSAFGRPISADARRRFVTHWLDFGPDAVVPIGIMSNFPGRGMSRRIDNWYIDIAHQPELAYIPYLISGDWYFLEELQFWASRNLLEGTYTDCNYCRHDDWAFINESNAETRGLAWGLRSLGHAAFFSPDETPEKAYFTQKLENNIAIREGVLNIRNGSFYDDSKGSMWDWGRNVVAGGIPNPLRFPHRTLGTTPRDSGGMSCIAEAVWMVNLNHVVWGHLEELGFQSIRPLRTEAAKNWLQQILDPNYPKNLLAAAYIPTRGLSEGCQNPPPFSSWTEVANAVPEAEKAASELRWKQGAADPEFGYPAIGLAAASFLPGIVDEAGDGQDAWAWFKDNLTNQNYLNNNPKWALLPREPKSLSPQSLPRRRPTAADEKIRRNRKALSRALSALPK